MPSYSLVADNVECGPLADTFETLAALIVADTAGHRCRIMSIEVSPADDTPADATLVAKLCRIADVSEGAPGTLTAVAVGNIGKADPDSFDSIVSGGWAYTVEPETYETEPLWESGMNCRGAIVKYWDRDNAKVFNRDMLAGVLVAARSAVARTVNITIEFETF